MKITVKFLKKHEACEKGIEWFKKQNTTDAKQLFDIIIKENDKELLQFANWTIVRKLDKWQKIQYAIYASKQSITYWKEKYPDVDIPQQAIKAAYNYLKLRNKESADAAYAAAYAAEAADAVYAAAYAAAYAAVYAAEAAYAAADAAAYAAYAAADAAADAAYAAYAAEVVYYNKMLTKILKFGWKILENK